MKIKLSTLRELIRETVMLLEAPDRTILDQVDQVFNSVGVYPPRMVQVKDTPEFCAWEGEIDSGFTLVVTWSKLPMGNTYTTVRVNDKDFDTPLALAKYYKKHMGKKGRAATKVMTLYANHNGLVAEMPDGSTANVAELTEREPGWSEDVEDEAGDEYMALQTAVLRRLVKQHGITHIHDTEQGDDTEPVDEFFASF